MKNVEELLEMAKSKYPPGTRYECLHIGGMTGTVTSNNCFIVDLVQQCVRTNGGGRCLYDGSDPNDIRLANKKTKPLYEIY